MKNKGLAYHYLRGVYNLSNDVCLNMIASNAVELSKSDFRKYLIDLVEDLLVFENKELFNRVTSDERELLRLKYDKKDQLGLKLDGEQVTEDKASEI